MLSRRELGGELHLIEARLATLERTGREIRTKNAYIEDSLTLDYAIPSTICYINENKNVVSTALSSVILPTVNQITITSLADGSIAVGTVQDIGTTSVPTFAGLGVNGNISITGTVDGVDISSFNNAFINHTQNSTTAHFGQDLTITGTPTFNQITINDTPVNPTDATTKEYVDLKHGTSDWQSVVISVYDPTISKPPSPSVGDRYISGATANGWIKDNIYEWTSLEWYESVVTHGTVVYIKEGTIHSEKFVFYNSVVPEWQVFETQLEHQSIVGSGSYTHTQIDSHISNSTTAHFGQDLKSTANPTFYNVNVSTEPTESFHLTNKGYVDALIQGINWQKEVLEFYDPTSGTPPSPTDKDRYISILTASGWTMNYIYEWDTETTQWVETIPNTGFALYVDGGAVFPGTTIMYNGIEWVRFGSTIDHTSLINIGVNTHAQIDLHIANDTTAHFGQDLKITAIPSFTGLNITGTTNATSTDTGIMRILGGIGIAKDIHANNMVLHGNTETTSDTTGTLIVYGGAGITGDTFLGGKLHILSTEDTTTISAGSIITEGGLSVIKNLFIGQDAIITGQIDTDTIQINSTIDATDISTGSIHTNGGASIEKNLFVGGTITTEIMNIKSTNNSTDASTGSLVIEGGVGIVKTVNIGEELNVAQNISSDTLVINSTTESTSSTSGAVIITGGTGIGGNLTVGGDVTVGGEIHMDAGDFRILTITGTDDATSTNSGVFQVMGGVGIAKNTYIGQDIHIAQNAYMGNDLSVTGNAIIQSTNDSTDTQSGALQVDGGMSVKKTMHIGENMRVNGVLSTDTLQITTTEESTSTSSGSVLINGGVGMGGNMNVGGLLNVDGFVTVPSIEITNVIQSTDTESGSIIVGGGTSIGMNLNVGGDTHIYSTNDTTSVSTGSLITDGGVGIMKDVYVGGMIHGNLTGEITTETLTLNGTDDSTSTDTGTLQVLGGVGIAKNLYIGGIVDVENTIYSHTSSNNMLTLEGSTSGNIGVLMKEGDTYYGYIRYGAENSMYMGVVNGGVEGNATKLTPAMFQILLSADSSSTSTGAMQILGGVGIAKNLYAQSVNSIFTNSGDYSTHLLPSMTDTQSCNIALGKSLTTNNSAVIKYVYDSTLSNNYLSIGVYDHECMRCLASESLYVVPTTESTSTNTGSVITMGGAGIAKSLFVGSKLQFPTVVNKKRVVIYDGTDNDYQWYGFGIQSNELRYQIASSSSHHSFYAGLTDTTEQELMRIEGDTNAQQGVTIYHTAQSTSMSTGSIVVSGGAGIAKDVHVSGMIYGNVTGTITTDTLTLNGTINSTSTDSGTLQVLGGVGISKDVYMGGKQKITNTATSTSTSTGALVVSGGVGVGGTMHVMGPVTITNGTGMNGDLFVGGETIFLSSPTSKILFNMSSSRTRGVVLGDYYTNFGFNGIGMETGLFRFNLYRTTDARFGWFAANGDGVSGGGGSTANEIMSLTGSGTMSLNGTTQATSTSTGTLQIFGGVGIAKDLYVGGSVYGNISSTIVTGTNDSTSTNSGVLQVRGGTGIAKNLYVGGIVDIANTIHSHTTGDNMMTLRGSTTGNVGISMGESDNYNGYMRFISDNSMNIGIVNAGSEYINIVMTTTQTTISMTTESTSSSTGALIVLGGLGVQESIYAPFLNITGTTNVNSVKFRLPSSNDSHLEMVTFGHTNDGNYNQGLLGFQYVSTGNSSNYATIGLTGFADILRTYSNRVTITPTTESTSSTTGSLIVNGGLGVIGSLYGGNGGVISKNVSDNPVFTISNLYPTSDTAVNDPTEVVRIHRIGTDGVNDSAFSQIMIDRYEHSDANARTRMTIGLAHGISSETPNNIIQMYSDGRVSIPMNIVSTSTDTGTLQVIGGVGISGDMYVGGTIYGDISGSVTTDALILTGTDDATSTNSGTLQVRGGTGITKNLYVGGETHIVNTTTSTSNSTGALVVEGGMGVNGDIYSSNIDAIGRCGITFTTDQIGGDNGSFIRLTTTNNDIGLVLNRISTGGSKQWDIYIDRTNNRLCFYNRTDTIKPIDIYTTGEVNMPTIVESTSTNTGTLIVGGGTGIGGKLNVGGAIQTTSTTESQNTSTGSLIVGGGGSIAKRLFIGGSIYGGSVDDTTNISNMTLNGTFISSSLMSEGSPTHRECVYFGKGTATNPMETYNGMAIGFNYYSNENPENFGSIKLYGGNDIVQIGLNYFKISQTIESTSTSTGVLRVLGGVGIAKNLYVGGMIYGNITGTITTDTLILDGTDDATSTDSGTLQVIGGVGVGKSLFVGSKLQFPSTETKKRIIVYDSYSDDYRFYGFGIQSNELRYQIASSSSHHSFYAGLTDTTEQELMRIEGDTNAQQGVTIYHTTQSTSMSTGSIVVSGGAGIAKDVHVGGMIYGDVTGTITTDTLTLNGTINSTSTDTGTLIVEGGTGIAKDVYVGGMIYGDLTGTITTDILTLNGTDNSTSTDTGTLVVGGGIGIAKDAYVGGMIYGNLTGTITTDTLTLTGTDDSTSTDSGTLVVNGGLGVAKNLYANNINSVNNIIVGDNITSINSIYGVGASRNVMRFGNSNGVNNTAHIGFFYNSSSHADNAILLGMYTDGTLDNPTMYVRAKDTASTSTSTGALTIAGGVGMNGSLYIGGSEYITGATSVINFSNDIARKRICMYDNGNTYQYRGFGTDTSQLRYQVDSPTVNHAFYAGTSETTEQELMRIRGDVSGSYGVSIFHTSVANSTTTGALVVAGGVGIAGDLYVGGTQIIPNITVSGTLKTDIIEKEADANGITISSGSKFYIADTTNSNSTDTGSLQVLGGVGIAKNLYVGGATYGGATLSTAGECGMTLITDYNATTLTGSYAKFSTQYNIGMYWNRVYSGADHRWEMTVMSSDELILYNRSDGLYGFRITNSTGLVRIPNGMSVQLTTDSGSTNTGALTVSGGVGIAKNCYIGGETLYLSSLTSQIRFNGSATRMRGIVLFDYNTDFGYSGMGMQTGLFRFNLYRTDNARYGWFVASGDGTAGSGTTSTEVMSLQGSGLLALNGTIESTSSSTGILTVAGGVGIAKDLYVGGDIYGSINTSNITITGTVDSTSTDSGALQVLGGVGLAKSLFAKQGTIGTKEWNVDLPVANLKFAAQFADQFDADWYSGSGVATTAGNVQISCGRLFIPDSGGLTTNYVSYDSDINITSIGTIRFKFTYYGSETFDDNELIIISNTTDSGKITVGFNGDMYINITNATQQLFYCETSYTFIKETEYEIELNFDTTETSTFAGRIFVDGQVRGIDMIINGGSFTQGTDMIIGNSTSVDLSIRELYIFNTMMHIVTYTPSTFFALNESTSASTGAIVAKGGIGVVTSLSVGDQLEFPAHIKKKRVVLYDNTSNIFQWRGMGVQEYEMSYQVDATTSRHSFYAGVSNTSDQELMRIEGNLGASAGVRIYHTTQSTNASTGSFVVNGGVGIARNVFVGGGVSTSSTNGIVLTSNATHADVGSNAAFSTPGGYIGWSMTRIKSGTQRWDEYIDNDTNVVLRNNTGGINSMVWKTDGSVNIPITISSTSSSTGALTIGGGMGIGKEMYIGPSAVTKKKLVLFDSNGDDFRWYGLGIQSLELRYQVNGTTAHHSFYSAINSTSEQELMRIEGSLSSTSGVSIKHTTDSSSSTTGALTVAGGVGIAKNLYVENDVYMGTLSLRDGIGNYKYINNNSGVIFLSDTSYVDGTLGTTGKVTIYDTTESANTNSGSLIVNGGAGIAKNLYVGGTIYGSFSGSISTTSLTLTDTTDSASTNSGALQVRGGAGIAKNLYVGSMLYSTTAEINRSGTSEQLTVANGTEQLKLHMHRLATYSDGRAGIYMVSGGTAPKLYIGSHPNGSSYLSDIIIPKTTEATSSSTGALTVAGGIGIAKKLHVGGTLTHNGVYSSSSSGSYLDGTFGNLYFQSAGSDSTSWNINTSTSTQLFAVYPANSLYCTRVLSAIESTSSTTGSLVVSGGVGIAKKLYVGGEERILNTTESGLPSTGALTVSGGVGIAKKLCVGGEGYIFNTAESTSTDTGSLQVLGGVGIAKNLWFGGVLKTGEGFALGRLSGVTGVSHVMVYGPNGSGYNLRFGFDTTITTNFVQISNNGNLNVTGSLTKGSGSFQIPHPDPSKEGWKLRHCFVESPTRGDNIYRYQITTKDCHASIALPNYYTYLNENTQVWITAVDVLGFGRGTYDESTNTVNIEVNTNGTYNVLVIGTRKDEIAKKHWDKYGIEVPPENST